MWCQAHYWLEQLHGVATRGGGGLKRPNAQKTQLVPLKEMGGLESRDLHAPQRDQVSREIIQIESHLPSLSQDSTLSGMM